MICAGRRWRERTWLIAPPQGEGVAAHSAATGGGRASIFVGSAPTRRRPLSRGRDNGASPLHLPIPALVPVGALLVDRVPIDDDQLLRTLADRRHAGGFRRHLRAPVDRPVAVFLGEDFLELRLDQHFHELLRERRGVRLGDRTRGGEQRRRAFFRIDEVDRETGGGKR